jgi:hypothetical protein
MVRRGFEAVRGLRESACSADVFVVAEDDVSERRIIRSPMVSSRTLR